MNILSSAYGFLSLLASPAALLTIATSKRGRRRLSERLGMWNLEAKDLLWFHGASVGEIHGLIPIIKEFRIFYPDKKILLTATSATGLERGEKYVDFVRLLPLDNRLWVRKALKTLSISCFVCAETEIWPELLRELYKSKVPVFFVNARISSYSYKYYSFFRGFLSGLLSSASGIYAATEEARARFISLGLEAGKVLILGNAKYDSTPTVTSLEEALSLKKEFFKTDSPVLTLGSIRPGEEKLWFPEIKELQEKNKSLNIVIAPRHAEKYEFFVTELEKYDLQFVRWSEKLNSLEIADNSKNIILLDTFGQLESVYSFTDIAFIGGTIVDWGGHNPLEAAQYRCAIAIGPWHSNVSDIVKALKDNNAVDTISDRKSVRALLQKILNNPGSLKQSGEGAYAVWEQNAGASKRIVEAVTKQLNSTAGI